MPVKIKNLTKHLVIVTFNSGITAHLAPGESSRPIEDLEINGNEKVAKLLRGNFIAATEAKAATPPSAAAIGKGVEPEKEPKKESKRK